MQRVSLRYELSAFPAMVRTLSEDPRLLLYYEPDPYPLPGLLEDVALTLISFAPAMTQVQRASIFDALGSLPAMEPPGILFALYEACSGGVRESRAFWYNYSRKSGKSKRTHYMIKG